MNWRLFISKLEKCLNKKYPHIGISFYILRRKRNIHMGIKKALLSYPEPDKILNDIENFWSPNIDSEFEFVRLPILIKTVK